MARSISSIGLTPEQRVEFRRRSVASTSTQCESLCARIVLLRSQGKKEADAPKAVGTSINTVSFLVKAL